MNIKAGICDDCGRYWTVTSGGLNDDRQCRECARKYPVSSKLVAVNEDGRRIGEAHPKAKHSDGLVYLVLILRDEGFAYTHIGYITQIPRRTVRDICKGKMRNQRAYRWKRVRMKDKACG